jgi:hypothetical protein
MSRCQSYLEHIGFRPPLLGVKHRQLIAGEAVTLRNCLQDDGGNSLYSAAVSLADALRGLREGFYTWATVKLYYSVFYTARCELALRNTALFYIGGNPVRSWPTLVQRSPPKMVRLTKLCSINLRGYFLTRHFFPRRLMASRLSHGCESVGKYQTTRMRVSSNRTIRRTSVVSLGKAFGGQLWHI